MPTHGEYFTDPTGNITCHMTYTTPDAVFTHNGSKVIMSFHDYLGPFFEIVISNELVDIYPDESEEYENLWKQFDGWYKAKGKFLYG